MSRVALALLLLLLGSGCDESSDGDGPRTEVAMEASVLVDRWFVEAPTAEPGTMLVLGRRAAVFLPCGVLSGEWRAADGGLFVADVRGGSQDCFRTGDARELPWLHGATAFRTEGEQVLLLAEDGSTTARLRPGAQPTTGPDHSAEYAEMPSPHPEQLRVMSEPAPLPDGVVAPTPSRLQRRWAPVSTTPQNREAFLSFTNGSRWRGSDGCNGTGGHYVLGAAGRLIGTTGLQTLIGCDNWRGSQWVAEAARVGLRGDELVFFDHDARELGRVVPAGDLRP